MLINSGDRYGNRGIVSIEERTSATTNLKPTSLSYSVSVVDINGMVVTITINSNQ